MAFCAKCKLTTARALSFQEVSPNCHKVPFKTFHCLWLVILLHNSDPVTVSVVFIHSCFPVQQPNLQHPSLICSLCHHGITETRASRKCKEKPNFSHTNHCSSRAKQQKPESEYKLLTDRQLSYPHARSISPLSAAQWHALYVAIEGKNDRWLCIAKQFSIVFSYERSRYTVRMEYQPNRIKQLTSCTISPICPVSFCSF